ncbi:MAG: hypothetical protein QM302_02745 [Acidobacteriota bacterium]|nr:hypothetical protein [Acidobacteriota bacterium]
MKRICRGLAVLPMWCLALVLAFGTVLLSACAPEDAPADDPAPVEREAEPTDDVEPEPEPEAQKAVWVVTKDTQTYTVGEDSSSAVVEYELDGHGNVTKVTSDGYVESFERDADGIVTSKTTSYGDDQEVVEYRVERDESGRAVKIVGTDGSVETRSYDDDGNLVERIYQGTYPSYDEEGDRGADGTYQTTETYDADGLLMASESSPDGGQAQKSEHAYERDDAGRVVSVTRRVWSTDDDGEPIVGSVFEERAAIEYDDNGNIVRKVVEGESFSLVTEYEYAEVEDASLEARINAHLKPF